MRGGGGGVGVQFRAIDWRSRGSIFKATIEMDLSSVVPSSIPLLRQLGFFTIHVLLVSY